MPELLCKFFCRKRIYAFFRHIEKTYICQRTQLNSCNKTFECLTSFRCTLVHTCILQYFIKDQTDFLMQNIHHIVFCDLIILRKETFCPFCMRKSVWCSMKCCRMPACINVHRRDVRRSNVLLQLFNCVLWQI